MVEGGVGGIGEGEYQD